MRKKLFIIIVIAFSLILLNSNKIYRSISKSLNNKNYKTTLSEQRVKNYNKMKIDSVIVKSRFTGTAPFNGGSVSNADGIDVSEKDNYVRTFDSVNYVLELGIIPNTDENGVTEASSFDGGVIKIKAKLPNQGDKLLMYWEEDAWMRNVKYNSDKTEMTCEYHVPSDVSITHANQSLSFKFKVNGYKKEITEDMAPEFEVWMEGNKPDNSESTIDSVKYKDTKNKLIISGKPSYDIDVQPSTYLYPGKKGETVGQYVAYGVGVALIQPYSYINDLRGVEFPTGEFEIQLENVYEATNKTKNTTVNVTESTPGSLGVLNNASMIAYSVNNVNNDNYYPTSHVFTRNLPIGKGSGKKSVTDSGIMNVSINSNITKVTFNNYILNNNYPSQNIVADILDVNYPENYGYIMAGNVQMFIPNYDNSSTDKYSYVYRVNVLKARYRDTNGNVYELNGSDEIKKNNNTASSTYLKENNGSFYVASQVKSNNIETRDGLASAVMGSYIEPTFTLMPVTGPYEKAERIIVWNTKYFEIAKKNNNDWVSIACGSELGFPCNGKNGFSVKYGIYKNNSTGIEDDTLVNSAYFDDFNWYDTVEEAKQHGTISAIYGLDTDVLGNRVHRYMYPKFKIIDNPEIVGKVGIITHRVRVYDKNGTIVYEPYKTEKYKKAAYSEEGLLVSNHVRYQTGLGVLVLSAKADVDISVTDKDADGKMKTSYDVSDGYINIKLSPTLVSNKIYTADVVTITSTLPAGLDYKEGSSNKEPKNVDFNNDGTTTITWEYVNWKANENAPEYPNIEFKAEISAFVPNNSSLDIDTTIFHSGDIRDIRHRKNSYKVSIYNLSGSKAVKEVDKSQLEYNESFVIRSEIGTTSKKALNNVKAFEILPKDNYDGYFKIKLLSLSEGQRFYYSIKNLNELNISQDVNGKQIVTDVDDNLWTEVGVGDEIPEDATALLTTIDKIITKNDLSYTYEVIPYDNKVDNTYLFSMNIICDNLITSVKTNTVVSSVVNRRISGTAYKDLNGNEVFDTEDEILKDIDVKLLDENNKVLSTIKTDEEGKYLFEHLDKGNYYIQFSMPVGYTTISINDNKANPNGKTNLIEHNEIVDITDVNLGITKKRANVITHHYYEGTTNKIAPDKTVNYEYGDEYSTVAATNIPNNYEFKNIVGKSSGTVYDNNIEVIYYYKMKASSLNTNISKVGTDKITSKQDEFNYSIEYNIDLDQYIGNANVTIIDKLPFAIDIEKSELSNGVYDENNKTITWNEVINNIDTFTGDKNYKITKEIKVVYKDMLLTTDSVSNSVTGKVVLSNNNHTSSKKFTTVAEIPSIIIERFYDRETNNEIHDVVINNGYVGQKFTPNPLKIKGYELVSKKIGKYTYTDGEQEIVYIYTKSINNPNTSDNIIKYVFIFIGSLIVIISRLVIKKLKNS